MSRFIVVSFIAHISLYLFMINYSSVELPQDILEVELTEFSFEKVKFKQGKSNQKNISEVSDDNQDKTPESLFQQAQSKERYLSQIYQLVKRQQTYPIQSKKLKEQGLVKVLLTIDPSGSLKKVELIEKTPFKRLNDAAMQAAVRAAPFEPFPSEVSSESWKIAIPIQFLLK